MTVTRDTALVGFGHLGQAIADYRGFEPSSFRIAAIFDHSPQLVGNTSDHGILVQPAEKITRTVCNANIALGIVAVQAAAAQEVADQLIDGGVRAILNYAHVDAASSGSCLGAGDRPG